MRSAYTIGRIAGVDLKMHVTFPLLLVWIAYRDWTYAGPAAAAAGVVLVLAVFGCVVLHEFGHVLMARRYGIQTRDVVLLPIGGVARLQYFPTDPRQELLIALAGPAVTLAIAAALLLVVRGLGLADTPIATLTVFGHGFLYNLLVINVYILLFNLIPAFPMDGGRVLRALLSSRLGLLRGTRLAVGVGKALAVTFALLAIFSGPPPNWFLLLIAAFVFMAAGAEGAAVEAQLRHVPPPPPPPGVPTSTASPPQSRSN